MSYIKSLLYQESIKLQREKESVEGDIASMEERVKNAKEYLQLINARISEVAEQSNRMVNIPYEDSEFNMPFSYRPSRSGSLPLPQFVYCGQPGSSQDDQTKPMEYRFERVDTSKNAKG